MSEKNSRDEIMRSLLNKAFYDSVGGTSLSEIATAAGIKKSSIYNHFNSRDDLIIQTTKSCGEYIAQINFIPDRIDDVTKKYDASAVLNGIVKRYLKMHLKSPLFQIYTFIHTQKHFDSEAAQIAQKHTAVLIEQAKKVFSSLVKNKKLMVQPSKLENIAVLFVYGTEKLLSDFLAEVKKTVLANPRGNDEFVFQGEDELIEKAASFAENFLSVAAT